MHSGRTYRLGQTLYWTRNYILIFFIIDTIPVLAYQFLGWTWITIPWLPIALIGTAVAFYLGFKNNSSYERLWEARKIWGGIVNSSRTWAIFSRDYVTNLFRDTPLEEEELNRIHRQLIYRHIAWLRTLAIQLRAPKSWEHNTKTDNRFRLLLKTVYRGVQQEDVQDVLPPQEAEAISTVKNPAMHLISHQSQQLQKLRDDELIDDFRHMAMGSVLEELYTLQGKCERIKNFPFPRQYATVNYFFVWLFIILVPAGMLGEFEAMGEYLIWLSVPFSVIVSWVFHTMEMIGDYSENPFEGLYNDVPITAMARGIEIDLRSILNEEELPDPLEPETEYNILV